MVLAQALLETTKGDLTALPVGQWHGVELPMRCPGSVDVYLMFNPGAELKGHALFSRINVGSRAGKEMLNRMQQVVDLCSMAGIHQPLKPRSD